MIGFTIYYYWYTSYLFFKLNFRLSLLLNEDTTDEFDSSDDFKSVISESSSHLSYGDLELGLPDR